ncbi:uncharacterized protein LOC132745419 [Ruditapes philippinarum]|uniref:uncharacterized protein LOC132745419 n=1 Tax=Ruditapes philippinarum TaxID=129788 RepID=UPI00295C0638|nr:uncharacterized protein LOC132745419 [Ruditapes philippinarum]
MKICVAFAALVAVCLAATTQKPHHHTHEPNEGESFTFAYNGHTHDFIVRHRAGKTYICYVATVTADEMHLVHTDAGMRSLELRILGLLSSATEVQPSAIDAGNVKLCGHPHNATVIYKTIS